MAKEEHYLMPAVPPVLVGVPVLRNFANGVEPGVLAGMSSPAAIIGISLAVFFLVYAVYIVIAYLGLKREVLPEK